MRERGEVRGEERKKGNGEVRKRGCPWSSVSQHQQTQQVAKAPSWSAAVQDCVNSMHALLATVRQSARREAAC